MKRVILLLSCLLVAGVSNAQKSDYSKSPKATRFVAYNAGVFPESGYDSMPDVARMMRELSADAVAICEMDSCNRRHSTFQTEDFQKYLGTGWDYRYASAMHWNGGSYGTGVVTSKIIINSFDIKLLKGDRYEPRVCVVAETPEYVIASVYLDHSNDSVRVEQAEVITNDLLKRYKASRKPVFLCGDLNADPQSQTLKCFSKDWKIISRPDPTYPSDNPEECVDYILVMKNKARYKVVKTAVCTELDSVDVTGTSDHLPVFVDVVIK